MLRSFSRVLTVLLTDRNLFSSISYAVVYLANAQIASPSLSAGRPGSGQSAQLATIPEGGGSPEAPSSRSRRAAFLSRWDGWRNQWGGAGDPILALHYQYAVLFTASPLVWVSPGMWQDMTQDAAGYEQLEKARDGAIDLIRSICSPEIARSLP